MTTLSELDHVDDGGNSHFKDGSVLRDGELDVCIWGTGYSYSVPFADPTDEPWRSHPLIRPRKGGAKPGDLPADKVDHSLRPRGGAQIDNLDPGLQSFYIPDPSVAFIGLGESLLCHSIRSDERDSLTMLRPLASPQPTWSSLFAFRRSRRESSLTPG